MNRKAMTSNPDLAVPVGGVIFQHFFGFPLQGLKINLNFVAL